MKLADVAYVSFLVFIVGTVGFGWLTVYSLMLKHVGEFGLALRGAIYIGLLTFFTTCFLALAVLIGMDIKTLYLNAKDKRR